MQTCIFVTSRFTHFHRWPNAPQHYAYLSDLHRHEFHVRMEIPVNDLNREIEFIAFKEWLKATLNSVAQGSYPVHDCNSVTLNWSCEHWCQFIMQQFPGASFVEVSEDGENGATMMRTLEEIAEAQVTASTQRSP